MNSYAPLLAALVALLAGPDDRQGLGALQAARRQVDRPPPRARVAALHPRPELPRRQPDRPRDRRAEPRRQPRRRRARSAHDPRQPVSREGPGRQGDHRAPVAAAARRAERLEHAYVLLCLGLDYKRGGFVDRALEAFNEVLRLDPKNEYALLNLQKLHEEQHQWTEAYDTRQRLTKLAGDRLAAAEPGDSRVSRERDRPRGDAPQGLPGGGPPLPGARSTSTRARSRPISTSATSGSREGNDKEAASDLGKAGRRSRPTAPTSPSIGSRRWPSRTGNPERFTRLCRRLIDENPQDWRARLALSRHLAASGQPHEALDLLFAALVQNPHALSIHQAIWRALGQLRHPAGAGRSLRRADPARGLLSRSARLHALPLPQHRAALAVPALPRLEHVRRRADRAGAGHDGSRGLNVGVSSAICECAAECRSTCASVSSNVPSVSNHDSRRAPLCRRPASARPGAAAPRPRSGRARAAARSCVSGGQTVATTRSKSPARPVSYSSGMSTTATRRSADQLEGAQPGRDRAIDRRMDDRFELAPGDGVGEHDRRRASRDRPRRPASSTSAPNRVGDRLRRLGAGRHHAVRELVGVEARHAAPAELLEHVALAGRDAAGQRDFQHRVTAGSIGGRLTLGSCEHRRARPRSACSSAASRSSADRRRRAPASARRPPRSTSGCTSPSTSDAAPLEGLAPLASRPETAARRSPRSLDPRRADVDHRRARLDEVRRDERRPAERGDEDVGLARDARQIDGPRMADRHRGVAMQQQQRHRLADDVAAADDDRVRAGDRRCPSARAARSRRTACRRPAPARFCTSRPTLIGWKPSTSLSGDRSRRTRAARRRRPSPPAAATAPGCRRARRCDSAARPRRSRSSSDAVAGSRSRSARRPLSPADFSLLPT